MSVKVTNNACSATTAAIDDVVTTINIGQEGVFFPTLNEGDWFYATISDDPVATTQSPEIIRVNDIQPDGQGGYALTVERAVGITTGGTAYPWNSGAKLQLLVTAELLYDLVSGASVVAQEVSYILRSQDLIANTALNFDDATNGDLIRVDTGAGDVTITLPSIPATSESDTRYVFVNSGANNLIIKTPDGSGQTIAGSGSLTIPELHGGAMVHAAAGKTIWSVNRNTFLLPIPTGDGVYGLDEDYNWILVCEEAPENGLHYVRKDGAWVVGVGEAPQDDMSYIRKNGAWLSLRDLAASREAIKTTIYETPGSYTHTFDEARTQAKVTVTGGGGGGNASANRFGGGAGGTAIKEINLVAGAGITSATIVVGAGGALGNPGSNSSYTDGVNDCYAEGGQPGYSDANGSAPGGGGYTGARGVGGDANITGGSGHPWCGHNEGPGMGGTSYHGGGCAYDDGDRDAAAPGCGGRCGTNTQGGRGGYDGVVIVREIY